jgi:DNA-binding transcriptional ArsR family regulator
MKLNKAKLILHPVRLRIILALVEQEMTAGELGAQLTDVSRASLYRHLNTLTENGLLVITEEHRVRNTLERVYTLAEGSAHLSLEDLAEATKADHLRFFMIFAANLIGDFARYLDHTEGQITAETGYHTYPLHLNEAELAEFGNELSALLMRYLALPPGDGRQRRLLSLVMMPDAKPAAEGESDKDDET